MPAPQENTNKAKREIQTRNIFSRIENQVDVGEEEEYPE